MIKIDENQDKDVTYENEPESQRQLFPNIPLTVDVSPLQDAIDALDERMDDAESDIDSIMTTLQTFDGQPGVAETVSDMTDTNKIYVYVGSETGYTSGDWYYYDGTAWVSGGAYVANPVQIDDTLTQAGEAADAKVTGDEIAQLKSDFVKFEGSTETFLNVDFSNLFNLDTLTSNVRINITNGQTEGFSGQSATDFIPVIPGKIYVCSYSLYSSGNYGMAFYDATKTYASGIKQSNIGASSPTTPFTFIVPDGAYYARLSVPNTYLPDVSLRLSNGNIYDLVDRDNIGYTRIKADSVESGYINTNGGKVSNDDWGILTYSVSSFDKFRVTARGASATATIFVTNSNNDKLLIETGVKTGFEFNVPYGGTFLKVSNNWTYGNPAIVEKYTFKKDGIWEIDCYGDSLTFGNQDNTDVYYPKELWKLIGANEWSFGRYGFGGDKSAEIACMQGGITMYAEPFTIPSGTSAVEITLTCGDTSFTGNFIPADQNMSYLGNVTISGIAGAITYANSKYYFTRHESGSEVVLSRPEPVFTTGYEKRKNIQVFWAGTNDGVTMSNVQDLVNRIDDMIKFLETDSYMVLGLTCKNRISDIADVNAFMSRYYGTRFVNLRDYILTYGLTDAQITPTTQDETDIANGEIPSSLRSDTVHFNQYGYKIIANQVYKKGKQLGYWD